MQFGGITLVLTTLSVSIQHLDVKVIIHSMFFSLKEKYANEQ
jgi:hypothetical protein